MKIKNFFAQFTQDPRGTMIGIALVLLTWTIALAVVTWLLFFYMERRSQALTPTSEGSSPTIMLEPVTGPVETYVTVWGESWPANKIVFIFLLTPDEQEVPDYAIAGATADTEGRFTTGFPFPTDPRWQDQEIAVIIARTEDDDSSAQANFLIIKAEVALTEAPTPIEPASSPTIPDEAAAMPVPGETAAPPVPLEPTPTPSLAETSSAATPQPAPPSVTAMTNLNIRSGPGGTYPILGLLPAGQSATAIGISLDGDWWQIEYTGAIGDRGWVSANYVEVEKAGNLPIIQAPPLPSMATPTPTPTLIPSPTPVVYYPDWRGEYWPNQNLSGSPAAVRNDVTIDFNWGAGSPASGLPADNFSARWTRAWYFDQGGYRFHAVGDDGIRVYVDNILVIDNWSDGSRREATGELWLWSGNHDLRVEYYEHTGDASIIVWVEKISTTTNEDEDVEADFDAEPRGGNVPLRVEFDNDSEGDYDDCEWDFGDGDTDDDCDDSENTYHKAGRYTVELEVSGPGGEDTEEKEDYITVRPVARFTVDQRGGVQPLTVSFTNQSTEYDLSEWDFGDGSTSTAGNPTHTYSAAGVYTVRLQVKEASVWSELETKLNYIVVSPETPANQPPTAIINGPTKGLVGELLTFNGSSSSDPDGLISSYAWNFGDGTTANRVNVSHSYSQVGSYKITLTVTDDDGLSDTSIYTLLIGEPNPDQGPVAVINGPTSALVGETVIFDSGSSYDPDGTIVSYAWDFGDADLLKSAESGESAMAHVYNTPGTYQVTLTVTDNSGLSNTAKHPIRILQEPEANQPPVAVINGPANALEGEVVIFDSGGSHDPDGMIVSYAWDFGDSDLSKSAASGESTMAHIYNTPGTYQVTLTVIDNNGLNNMATHTIAVEAVIPNQPPVAVINGPTKGLVKEVLTFDGSSSSDPEGMLLSYAWDFGDGATTNGVKVSHSYSTAGNYNVILTVADAEGLKDTATYTIFIEEPPTLKPEPPTLTPELPTPTPEPPTPTPVPPTPTPELPTPTPEPPTPTPVPPTPTPVPPTPTPVPPTPTPEPPTPTPVPLTPTPEPPPPTPEPPTPTPVLPVTPAPLTPTLVLLP